ncbi:MAG: PAS domain-containing sensor histidine kinase, partial [Candidatus Eisenbacteria bacterium]|nr:PAS domain-containing sensor histidine kinase [Candidatus Eisenbacteria bacterium]
MQGRRESGRPARGREEEPARPALPLDASAPPAESDEQVGERCEEIGEREPETVNLVDASGSHSTWTRQVGVWETDPGTRGIHRSLLHDRIFGYVEPLPEWTYETFLSHVVAEDRETVDRKLREAMAAKSEWNLECRIRRHDGEVRWIWVAGGYIASDAGAPPRATGFVQDVTERKTAGTGARGRRERHQDLIETAGEFLWEMDLQARYTYCSPQMETLWGIPPQQMIGKTPFDRMPVQERKAALHAFRGFVRSPRPFRGLESTAFDAKGRPIFIESSGVPFFDEAGTLLGFRGVSRDVTEHKLAEDALREMDRRKDEFLAVLSHELRNPLAPIATALAILGHAAPGGDDARHAQAILERQVHQLTRLVDDLLDVTRIASNKIRLQKARVELNDLARKTVEDHRAAFGDKDVLLHFEASASPIHVEGDGSRLEQCLGNLLQNAVKFTEHGGTVTVSVSADPAAGNAVLRVADTGLGMAVSYTHLT